MSTFTSRWLSELDGVAEKLTSETSKSTFDGFAGSQVTLETENKTLTRAGAKSFEPIYLHNDDNKIESETGFRCSVGTCKTSKTSSDDDQILWRIEAMRAHIVDGVLPTVLRVADLPETSGLCWSCGDPMLPWDPTGKCVLCCLAAAQIVREDMRMTNTLHMTAESERTSR